MRARIIHHPQRRLTTRSRKSERGVTAIEYALIATLVVLSMVGGVQLLGNSLQLTYAELGRIVSSAL